MGKKQIIKMTCIGLGVYSLIACALYSFYIPYLSEMILAPAVCVLFAIWTLLAAIAIGLSMSLVVVLCPLTWIIVFSLYVAKRLWP
ncbi:hypothetical protein E3J79_03150 [Candidatus Dependentiae bacterium]|nr:MAG: hypothetical protein E3J79_03150 [Candidatus Dependentiae bacterium]